jgi:acetyltransferase-like isoleucine patch superfamily enzyme
MLSKLNQVLDTPWKPWNAMWRILAYPWIRLVFAFSGISWGQGWRIYGVPIVQKHRRSRITFGPRLGLRSSVRSNPLGPNRPVILCTWQAGAVLQAGANFAMTGGTLCAGERITIGEHVTVGANTTIIDTDFHPLDPAVRRLRPNDGATAPITIEDDVFIGMNCLILKGVTLGRGCVVGAGSVVTRDVPPYSVVAGNPAQVVRAQQPSLQVK